MFSIKTCRYKLFSLIYKEKVLSLSLFELMICFISESQKKKSNQDDSDEDDDDDDEAGPSTQQGASVQPQASYAAPMAQLGIPPVAGAHGMHPGGYQGNDLYFQGNLH